MQFAEFVYGLGSFVYKTIWFMSRGVGSFASLLGFFNTPFQLSLTFKKGKPMKYLIKHRVEFVITIVWFAILAYVLYDGFKNGTPAKSIVETVGGITVWYLNMPTSIEGSNHKKSIKEDKQLRNTVAENANPDEEA